MIEQLQLLVNIQDLDRKISLLLELLDEIPKELKETERALSEKKGAVEDVRLAIEELEKERRAIERELEARQQEIQKRRLRLQEVKTNEEYSAVLSEIDKMTKHISDEEDRILNIMMELDEKRASQVELEDLLRREEVNYKRLKMEKEAELDRHQKRLEEERSARDALASKIEPDLLTTYAKVNRFRDGTAVIHIKDGTCQGCFLTVTPQMVQEVKMNDQIITCPHCQRILYWKEE